MSTTLFDSSSGAEESSMDDNSHGNQTILHLQKFNQTTTRKRTGADANGEDHIGEQGDMEIWENFTQSFCQVQKVLDQNRILIQQVNENHQSKIPDNLAKNVALIREINGNISKVVSLYADLSTNFSSVFHQRREIKDSKAETAEIMDRSISDDDCGTSLLMFFPHA